MTDEKQRALVPWDIRPVDKEPLTLEQIIRLMNASIFGDVGMQIEPCEFYRDTKKKIDEKVPAAMAIKIKTDEQVTESKATLDDLKALQTDIETAFDVDRETADKIHKHVIWIRNKILQPVQNAIKHINDERKDYKTKALAKLIEKNKREAEKAKRKRKELEEKAEAAKKLGDETKAEMLQAKAENVTPATTPIKLTNISKTLEITDMRLLLIEIINEYPELIQYVQFPPASQNKLIEKVFDINSVNWDKRQGVGRQTIRDKNGNSYGVIVAQKIK